MPLRVVKCIQGEFVYQCLPGASCDCHKHAYNYDDTCEICLRFRLKCNCILHENDVVAGEVEVEDGSQHQSAALGEDKIELTATALVGLLASFARISLTDSNSKNIMFPGSGWGNQIVPKNSVVSSGSGCNGLVVPGGLAVLSGSSCGNQGVPEMSAASSDSQCGDQVVPEVLAVLSDSSCGNQGVSGMPAASSDSQCDDQVVPEMSAASSALKPPQSTDSSNIFIENDGIKAIFGEGGHCYFQVCSKPSNDAGQEIYSILKGLQESSVPELETSYCVTAVVFSQAISTEKLFGTLSSLGSFDLGLLRIEMQAGWQTVVICQCRTKRAAVYLKGRLIHYKISSDDFNIYPAKSFTLIPVPRQSELYKKLKSCIENHCSNEHDICAISIVQGICKRCAGGG